MNVRIPRKRKKRLKAQGLYQAACNNLRVDGYEAAHTLRVIRAERWSLFDDHVLPPSAECRIYRTQRHLQRWSTAMHQAYAAAAEATQKVNQFAAAYQASFDLTFNEIAFHAIIEESAD